VSSSSSSIQVTIVIQACQKAILEPPERSEGSRERAGTPGPGSALVLEALRSRPRTFGELFDHCGLQDGGRVGTTSHDRILDRSLQGLRRHKDIAYDRKTGCWQLVGA